MTTKARLKGTRLENEVEKHRGESNWKRVEELIVLCRAKGSGSEAIVNFLHSEWSLEKFIDDKCNTTDGLLKPDAAYAVQLKDAEKYLQHVTANPTEHKSYVLLEAHLLLAKLHYVCAAYQQSIQDVEKSQLENQEIQFHTLRTLRLVAEAYAIKGLCLEHLPPVTQRSATSNSSMTSSSTINTTGGANYTETQMLFCFEKSADLAIAYIQEMEKCCNESSTTASLTVPILSQSNTVSTPSGSGPHASSWNTTSNRTNTGNDRIGEFMETAIQRVPLLQLKHTQQQRTIEKGVEYYRRVLTAIGDKSVAQHLHQKLSRQLAEVLLRGVPDSSYSSAATSNAVLQRAQHMRFYMGSERGYYSPESRLEETLLVLSISEALAAREAVLSRADENTTIREESLMNVKAVQNLLTLVLSLVRQYQLIAGLFEKAMKFGYGDKFLWYQFALSLISCGKASRAALVLDEGINELATENREPVQLLLGAKLAVEQLGNYEQAEKYAREALAACNRTSEMKWLSTRAHLLLGLALSLRAQTEPTHQARTSAQFAALQALNDAVLADPKDARAHLFLSLQQAICRDLKAARASIESSLMLQPEQPFALMLLALILTAENHFNEAFHIVAEALEDFPTHYGLMVLRLKLETRTGRADAALLTARELLIFWKKADAMHVPVDVQNTGGSVYERSGERITVSQSPPTMMYDQRTASLGPPAVSGPPGRSSSSLHLQAGVGMTGLPLSASTIDVTDRESMLAGQGGAMSEYGGAASTISDSVGVTTGSSYHSMHTKWRCQANIWLELAELFLESGRMNDVQACVQEACAVFPNSHHTLYLNGRLHLFRAADCTASEGPLVEKLLNEAKACFLGALSILPSHVPSMRQLTMVYRAEDNLKMAEKVLRDLVKVDPLEHETWQTLGQVLAQQNRHDEATDCLSAATRLELSAPIMPFTVIPRVLHL